jgi:hypothetical protein
MVGVVCKQSLKKILFFNLLFATILITNTFTNATKIVANDKSKKIVFLLLNRWKAITLKEWKDNGDGIYG